MEALVPPGWAQRGNREQSLHNTYGEQENFGISAEVVYEPATCEEVQCNGWRDGWVTAIPADDPRASYVRNKSGRQFTEYTSESWNERGRALALARNEQFDDLPPGLAVFDCVRHQPCFNAAEHRKTAAVNPLFAVRDHWGGVMRQHSGPDPFLDDFRTHFEQATRIITD